MKKSTTAKVAKPSTAVAAKPVAAVAAKKAPAKTVKKAAAAPKRTAVVEAPSEKIAVAPVTKTAPRKLVSTTISAQIDVGFGNTLFIRGEGQGLSWEAGVAMESVGDSQWSISLPSVSAPVVFKLLINDQIWSVGENFVAEPGSSLVVSPAF